MLSVVLTSVRRQKGMELHFGGGDPVTAVVEVVLLSVRPKTSGEDRQLASWPGICS